MRWSVPAAVCIDCWTLPSVELTEPEDLLWLTAPPGPPYAAWSSLPAVIEFRADSAD